MPYPDFTQLLSQIRQKNIGEGLILAAQAQMMMNQDRALQETLAEYNAAKLDLDKKFATTSEQLSELNESAIVQEGGAKLEDLATSYMAMLDVAIKQQNELRNIVDTAQQRLYNIGTKEALSQAQALEQSFNKRTNLIRSKAEIPLKVLQFKNTMLNNNIAKLNLEKAEIELDELRSNLQVMEHAADIILSDPKGWMSLESTLTYNHETGRINYEKTMAKFYEEKIMNNERIPEELKGKVMKYFDLLLSKKIRVYDPPNAPTGSQKEQAVLDDLNYITSLYNWLQTQTQNMYEIYHSPRFAGFRESYQKIADEYIAELEANEEELSEEQKEKIRIPGSTYKVVERYKEYIKDSGFEPTIVDVGLGLPTDPAELVTYLYNLNYNENNEMYYWKQLEKFKKKLGIKKIVPLVSKKDEVTGADLMFHNIHNIIVNAGGQEVSIPFDLSKIASNDEGYYLPSYGSYPPNVEIYDPTAGLEPFEKPKEIGTAKEHKFNSGELLRWGK